MRLLTFSSLILMLVLTSCFREVLCPEPENGTTTILRYQINQLHQRVSLRELWINGVDNTSFLDSLRMRNIPLSIREYEIPYYFYSGGCPIIDHYGFGNRMIDETVVLNDGMRLQREFGMRTINANRVELVWHANWFPPGAGRYNPSRKWVVPVRYYYATVRNDTLTLEGMPTNLPDRWVLKVY